MPKSPITSRTGFFSVLRGPINRTVTDLLDWNAVDTELGTMVESRNLMHGGGVSPIVQMDTMDTAYTTIIPIDGEQFIAQYGSGGYQLPRDFNA